MPDDYLTRDEFHAWADGFDRRLADAIAVRQKADETAQEVAILKDRSNREDERTRRLSTIVSAAVASAVSAVIGFLFRGTHA